MKQNHYLLLLTSLLFIHVQSLHGIDSVNNGSFIDISKFEKNKRVAKSQIVQFCYTSELNIGDYLPTLGIRHMLGMNTDLWSIKDPNIDFDFINSHYKCAIIGGAGILSKRSEHFYRDFLKGCKIPVIIWGVGMCLPNVKPQITEGINKQVALELESRCDLVNVRDELTAHYYGFTTAHIAACPTIAYIKRFREHVEKKSNQVLFSSHVSIVPEEENAWIISTIKKHAPKVTIVNNLFKKEKTVSEINATIMEYCKSGLVVTTRLHGAIIAYGLGIPYIIIPFDDKLRAFHQKYGNGVIANNVEELKNYLKNRNWISLKPIQLKPVVEFGRLAQTWALGYCK